MKKLLLAITIALFMTTAVSGCALFVPTERVVIYEHNYPAYSQIYVKRYYSWPLKKVVIKKYIKSNKRHIIRKKKVYHY